MYPTLRRRRDALGGLSAGAQESRHRLELSLAATIASHAAASAAERTPYGPPRLA